MTNDLRHHDYYMVAADFDAYSAAQRRIEERWVSSADWMRACIMNIAHMGWFSSDRTIGEYGHDVWGLVDTAGAGGNMRQKR